MARWNLDSIPWHLFDASKVNPDHVILAKTASVVEYNSADYVQYLVNVFGDDAEMRDAAKQWGDEEIQHGRVLAAWAKLADPMFDFEVALQRFRDSFQVPLDTNESIRGSRSAELVARCVVECGTTSYYASLADSSDEPVFKAICKLISVDEVQHYNLFFRFLKRYLKTEPISRWARLKTAISRVTEAGEEELLYAYASANLRGPVVPSEMPIYLREYMGRVFSSYSEKNLRKGIVMAWRAAGFEKPAFVPRVITKIVYHIFRWKAHRLRIAAPSAPQGLLTSA